MLFRINYILYILFGKNKVRELWNGVRVYISDNYPFLGQGIYCGLSGIFINRVEHKDGSYSYITDLEDLKTKRHEVLGHHFERFYLGFFRFWWRVIKSYLSFAVPHDKKEAERYPESVEEIK